LIKARAAPINVMFDLLRHRPLHSIHRHGFSVTEMVMAISIMGILAAIIMGNYGDLQNSTRVTLANQRLEMLNQSLGRYATAFREIIGAPLLATDQDEQLILMTLQMEQNAEVRGPFTPPTYRPRGSSSANDFRMRFNGVRFELLLPGSAGTGLKIEFDGSDFGPPRTFPPTFRPFGS